MSASCLDIVDDTKRQLEKFQERKSYWESESAMHEDDDTRSAHFQEMQQDLTNIQEEYLDAQTRSFVLKALTTSASNPESYLDNLMKNGGHHNDVKRPKLDAQGRQALHDRVTENIADCQNLKQQLEETSERVSRKVEQCERIQQNQLNEEEFSGDEENRNSVRRLRNLEYENATKQMGNKEKEERINRLNSTLEALRKTEKEYSERLASPLSQARDMSGFYGGLYENLQKWIGLEIKDDKHSPLETDKGGNPTTFSVRLGKDASVRVHLKNASELGVFVSEKAVTNAYCKSIKLEEWPLESKEKAKEIINAREGKYPLACTIWKLHELVENRNASL
eukprot:gb/GECG01009815.1/.p1 GENE.gb/GECG01009815.1/~~gb/GECG01009815.1/.p1  ORF type:complete len:337 (+),score=74.63 gb/GECG01009815.1/:1-1011(+)